MKIVCFTCLHFEHVVFRVINRVVDLVHNDMFFATKVQVIMWIMEHVHGFDCVAIPVRTVSLVGWRVTGWSHWKYLCVPWILSTYPEVYIY